MRKNQTKTVLKKCTSILVACGMIFGEISAPLTTLAADKNQNQVAEYDEEALKAELGKNSDKYPNGLFAFANSQVTALEGEDSSITVVRCGGTKGEAKVTLSLVDVSAKYGEDYLASITENGKTTVLDQEADSQTLMEKYGSDMSVLSSTENAEEAEDSAQEEVTDSQEAPAKEEAEVETKDEAAQQNEAVEEDKTDEEDAASVEDETETNLSDAGDASETVEDETEAALEDAEDASKTIEDEAEAALEDAEDADAEEADKEEAAADETEDEEAVVSEEKNATLTDANVVSEEALEEDAEQVEETETEETVEEKKADKADKADVKKEAEEDEEASDVENLSGIAKAQAIQNGEIYDQKTWRELEEGNTSEADEATKALANQGIEEMKEVVKDLGGLSYTFTFKDGEYKKTVDLKMIDDTLSETDEQVMFFLQDAKGAELSNNYTAYVNIKDNEKVEEATYQFSTNDIKVPRGTDSIDIALERTSGVNQLGVVTVGTSEKTAQPGVDYEAFSQEVVFAPGVTTKNVTVNLKDLPLNEQPSEDVYFYIGAKTKAGKVVESKNSVKITILADRNQDASYGEELTTVTGDGMQAMGKSKAVFSGDYGVWRNGYGFVNAFGNYDLRTASKISVTFISNEGYRSYTEGSGCSKKTVTKYGRHVTFYLCANGRNTCFYNNDSDGHIGWTVASCNITNDFRASNASVHLYFGASRNNNSAKIRVTNITVEYPGYTVKMDNSSTNAKGVAINPNNVHREKNYTGSASATDGRILRLGFANINGEESHTFYEYENSNYTYAYNQADKTTKNVTISSNNTDFIGYQIKKPDGTWVDFPGGKYIPDITSLIVNYGGYMQAGNTYIFRPMFRPKQANFRFWNSANAQISQTKAGKTEKIWVNKAKMGSFVGFNNNSSFTGLTMLDSLTLTAAANAGYAVYGFSTTSGGKAIDQIQSGELNKITLIPTTPNQIDVDINYEKSGIDVVADPSGRATNKGSVLYYDPKGVNTTTGNYQNKMTVEGVSINAPYTIVALPESTGNSNTTYRASWRDGTIDLDGDGKLSEKEKNANKNYEGFTPVKGNVLTMIPQRAYTKVYYDFELRQTITNLANRSYVTGRVSLEDTEIFSKKTSLTQLNGVTVAIGDEAGTTKYFKGDRFTEAGDGYFEFSGNGTYYAHDYLLLAVSYTADDGSAITANRVVNPDNFQDVVLKSDSVMVVDAADAYVMTTTDLEKQRGIESKKAIAYNSLDNGDNTYRLIFHVTSKNSNLQPRTGILRFYNQKGNEITAATITKKIQAKDDGYFSFDFNPKKLNLPRATTITFQVLDQDDTKYYERKTGIKLFEAIGAVEIFSAFHFGGVGKALDLLGQINATVDLGWEGDFDVKTNLDITKDPDDNSMTLNIGISIGGEKKFDNDKLKKAVDAKFKAEKEYFTAVNEGKKTKAEIQKLKEAKQQANKDYYDNVGNLGKAQKKTAKVAGGVKAGFSISLSVKLALDEEEGAYYFESFILTAAVEAAGNVEVQFATPIGITIFLGFALEVDGSASFVIAEDPEIIEPTKYYVTEIEGKRTIRDKDGKWNIFNVGEDADAFKAYGIFGFNPTITISAGAGVLGDLVKVTISGTAAFKMQFFVNAKGNNGMVNLSSAIEVKVLFVKAKWTFVSKDFNLFYEDPNGKSLGLEDENYLHDDAKLLQAESRDYLKNRSGWNGDAAKAKSLAENEQGLSEVELLKGVYSGTDIKLTAINDQGDYLGVFLDDELNESGNKVRSDLNSAAVYYTIYDHNSKNWSKPALLEDDGTVDQNISVFDLGNRGIFVTWSTANKEFTDDTARVDMMNAMDIHGAFFDKSAKTFGGIVNITKETNEDFASDVNPNVVYNNNALLVYYTKNEYEVSNNAEGEVVGDVVNPAYSAMAYRLYKFSAVSGTNGTWVEDYSDLNDYGKYKNIIEAGLPAGTTYQQYVKDWYGQVFFDTVPDVYIEEELDENGFWKDNKEPEIYAGRTVNTNVTKDQETGVAEEETVVSGSTVPSKTAPKIIDTDAISYNNLGMFAYTVDYDENLATVNDRDVYLQIYDFENGDLTHPIMITSDNFCDSDVHFVRVEDSELGYADTYLTWLNNGSIVSMNITDLIKENNVLKKKQTNEGQNYYIINKSSNSGYEPPMTLVQAKVNEEADNAVSAITSFDAASTDGYVYVAWTEDSQALKEGVEENSPDAIEAENQLIEHQVFMARYDLEEGEMTGDVQVTNTEGANYDNVSFVVNNDATITALASKAGTKVVKADEFNKAIEEHNKNVSKDEKVDKVSADDFTEYAAADVDNKSLVAMDINPTSVIKVKEFNLEGIVEGEENEVPLTLINDGIDTLKDATLTVTDDSGKSILYSTEFVNEDDVSEPEYKAVDSLKIDKLMGGRTYDARTVVKLDERETKAKIHVLVTAKNGDTLVDQTFRENLQEQLSVDSFTVTETEKRDVYDVALTVKNGDQRYASAKNAVVGIEKLRDVETENATYQESYDEKELVEFDIPELEKGESATVTGQVIVDSSKQFDTKELENGFIKETGTFFATYGTAADLYEVERKASGAQMDKINAITAGQIGDGKGISVAAGDSVIAEAMIKSSLANPEVEKDGTEGLQTIWEVEDDSIATVSPNSGTVTGLKEGSTTLTAYVLPKNTTAVATTTETDSSDDMNFAEEESNFVKVPNQAVKTYTTTLTVTKSSEGKTEVIDDTTPTPTPTTPTPSPTPTVKPTPTPTTIPGPGKTVVKNKITYSIAGSGATVTKADKSLKKAKILSTVKVNGKSYKVQAIGANVFKNNKNLKSVTIGANVTSIGKNAFAGCTKLTKIMIPSKVKTIGAGAFKGCTSLKSAVIGKSVTSIGKSAFASCKNLSSITFTGAKAPKIANKAFSGIAKKAVFKTPKGKKNAYKKVLKSKAGFKKGMKVK